MIDFVRLFDCTARQRWSRVAVVLIFAALATLCSSGLALAVPTEPGDGVDPSGMDAGEIVVQKFHDYNQNGEQDEGEPLIDWQVQWRELPTGSFTTTSLGASGMLTFPAEAGKSYRFCELEQAGWQRTTPRCVDAQVGVTDTVKFGNVQLGAILVKKFHDYNGNSTRDLNEPWLDNWPFNLYQGSNIQAGGSTANGGLLGFSSLPAGTYRVEEGAQVGWYNSTPLSQTVDLTETSQTLVFGNFLRSRLTVSKIWYLDGSEVSGNSSVSVCLQRTGPGTADQQALVPKVGTAISLTLTGGKYCWNSLINSVTIQNLWPGDYTITEENAPAGWTVDVPTQTATIASGRLVTVTLRNEQGSAGVRVHKYEDVDGSGSQDGDEPSLSGWQFCLFSPAGAPLVDSGDQPLCATTGGEGFARMLGAPDGEVKVCETPQDGWIATNPSTTPACKTIAVAGGEASEPVQFGNQQLPPATIVIRKVTMGGIGSFTFTGEGGNDLAASFTVATTEAGVAVPMTFTLPASNIYTVTESDSPAGWQLSAVDCTDGGIADYRSLRAIFPLGVINGLGAADTGSVIVAPSEPIQIICTFTNTYKPESVTVVEAKPLCVNNAPFVDYTVTPVNPVPESGITIRWLGSDNQVVQELLNQPLSGRLLWPGASLDGSGAGNGWPGWTLIDGRWVNQGSIVRPQATIEVLANPKGTVTVTYPAGRPTCSTSPRSKLYLPAIWR